MKKLFWSVLSFVSFTLSLAQASPQLDAFSEMTGVPAQTLQHFFETQKNLRPQAGSGAECLPKLQHRTDAREDFLICLAEKGRAGLDYKFFSDSIALKYGWIKQSRSEEILKSIHLLFWLEEMTRERLAEQGHMVGWYNLVKKEFLSTNDKSEFLFEDGDVVVGMGGSSISAMISASTNPPQKNSHAFMVRVRDGKISTLESLIETGVREFSWEHFKKSHYQSMTVLRWKDQQTRKAVAGQASDVALGFAKSKVPYDSAMDMQSQDKIFCSELVFSTYEQVSGQKITLEYAQAKSDAVFEFVSRLGVHSRVVPSPGDLLGSSLFEIVGDFRTDQDPFRFWEAMTFGHVLFDQVEEGKKIGAGVPIRFASWTTAGINLPLKLLSHAFRQDLSIIPDSLGPASLSLVVYVEKRLYQPILKSLQKEKSLRSLHLMVLWQLAERMDEILTRRVDRK